MTITPQDVLHVARLSCLQISEDEAQSLATELDQIVAYVQKLDELDTTGVEPTLQVSVTEAPLREDIVRAGVEKSLAFAEAPRADSIGFLVPGFVDET